VALRNALAERNIDNNPFAWAITQNNLAATMQALGEHEEDIGSLEASIPLYDAVLKVLTRDAVPLIWTMVSANRASAMYALAAESDYLDMAEASVAEFKKIQASFDGTDYSDYQTKALERAEQAEQLVASLQL